MSIATRPVEYSRGIPAHSNREAVEKTGKLVLFFIFLGTSGILDDKGGNPIGLPYVAELFQTTLLFFSVSFFLHALHKDAVFFRTDILVLILVFASWFVSAINASLIYKQPLLYGLIEDRRILNTLIYFPVVYAIRQNWVRQKDIISMLIIIASIAVILSLTLLSMDLVGDPDRITSLHKKDGSISIGAHFIVLSTLLAFIFAIYSEDKKIIWLAILMIGLAMLIFVVQNRKIVITIFAVMLLYSFKGRKALMFIASTTVIVGITLSISWPLLQETLTIQKLMAVWGMLLDENYLTQSARAHTIANIWGGLQETYYWGHGALSLLWHDGFHRYYGENFFLADVGLAGMFFRYGILISFLLIGLCIYIAFDATRRMNDSLLKKVVSISLVFVFLSPGAGIFLYAGLPYGLLLGIAAGFKKPYTFTCND